MKKWFTLMMLCSAAAAKAQFVVGTDGITIKANALFTVDGLVIQPSSDLSLVSNQLMRSSAGEALPQRKNTIKRIYQFSNPLTFTGSIGFFYDTSELNGNNEKNLQIAYNNTTTALPWTITANSSRDLSVGYIANIFSGLSFTGITATTGSAVLPVTLTQFSVQKNNNVALLGWDVANEMNMAYYGVERSADGQSFKAIGQVSANGYSNYSFTDVSPLAGANYYRLKMTDKDGSYGLSPTRQINFDNGEKPSVFPNPFFGQLSIVAPSSIYANKEASIINLNGQVVLKFLLNGNTTTLQTGTWPAGIYFLTFPDGGQSIKVIKQ